MYLIPTTTITLYWKNINSNARTRVLLNSKAHQLGWFKKSKNYYADMNYQTLPSIIILAAKF